MYTTGIRHEQVKFIYGKFLDAVVILELSKRMSAYISVAISLVHTISLRLQTKAPSTDKAKFVASLEL